MTEPISCAACSGLDVYVVEQWPAGKGARAMACRDCGLLFMHPQPSYRRGDACVAHTVATSLDGGLQASRASKNANAPTKKRAASALLAALDRYFPASRPAAGARVLDFGCDTGVWLNVFQDCGWETVGIEPTTDAAFVRHKRLTTVPPDPQFDLVIVYQVLEHLFRPLDTLRALAHALRAGGHCLISVPRLDTLAVHRQIPYCLRPRTHIVAFTEACLRGLLARAGLQVVATFHELDEAFTQGEPLRLRLLARKVEAAAPEPNPAAALYPILQALPELGILAKQPTDTPPLTDPIDCPACSGRNVQIIEQWRLSGKHARAVGCMDCGLLFVHPQPSRDVLNAYYAPEGGWQGSRLEKSHKPPQMRTKGSRAVRALFAALDRYFPASTPAAGARVFDFGCGPGTWLNSLQDHGWDTYGLEPSTDAAFIRHKRLLAIPSEPQFDLLIVYHVLEHLPRPLDTLRELAQALLPGGLCFVSVPRLDTLAVHHQADYCLHPRHHIVAFTETCLRGLLARAGLEVVASLHELESAVSKGVPVRLQLLARKTTAPPAYAQASAGKLALEPDPASALKPVIEAFVGLKKSA